MTDLHTTPAAQPAAGPTEFAPEPVPAPSARHTRRATRRRSPAGTHRPALLLAAAAAGAVLVNVLASGEPAAQAGPATDPGTSVAAQLELSSQSTDVIVADQLSERLGDLAASRSQREAAQDAAAQAAVAAQQKAAAEAQAAAEAKAAADAKAAAEAKAAAKPTTSASSSSASSSSSSSSSTSSSTSSLSSAGSGGSYQDYALGKLGGSTSQFSCLENLWGKESGWNPSAQNPGSSAYGIPQFLDSTWAGTGIAKTSNGYRQIDAG